MSASILHVLSGCPTLVCTNMTFALWPAGVCMVQWPTGGACGDFLVAVCGGHGRGAGVAAAGHVGQLPTLSAPQRLPTQRS